MTTATIALAVYIQITLAVKFPIVRTQYSAGALSSISCVYIRQGRTAHAHTPTHCLDFVNHQRSPSLVLFLNVLRLDFCRLGDRWSGTSRVRPSGSCSFTPYDKKKQKNDDPTPSIPWLCLSGSGRRTTARIKRSGGAYSRISGSRSSSAHPHRSCFIEHMR